MIKNLIAITALFTLTSCSGATMFSMPRSIPDSAGGWPSSSKCKTVDCIIDEYDQIITGNPESKGNKFEFMTGYKDAPMRIMKDWGTLTIEEMNPWWGAIMVGTLTFLPGYSKPYPGKYGDIRKCEVWYYPGIGWKWLVHELMHCQGYEESIPCLANLQGGYSKYQKEIMEAEDVVDWYDTSRYKNEDATWHDR